MASGDSGRDKRREEYKTDADHASFQVLEYKYKEGIVGCCQMAAPLYPI